jgi:hypothetical protein
VCFVPAGCFLAENIETINRTLIIFPLPRMPLGEEIGIISEELLQRLAAEQASQAVKVYGKESGATDPTVYELRVDFQSMSTDSNHALIMNRYSAYQSSLEL